MKKIGNLLGSFIAWIAFVGIMYYKFIPAFNLHSRGFWLFVVFVMMAPACILVLIRSIVTHNMSTSKIGMKVIGVGAGILVVMIALGIFSSTMFHASKYSSILKIEDYDFTKDIDEATALTKVALMDTESARILGNRKIGSLSNVVSQFNVDSEYSQIDFQGSPMKVAPLEYAGFFKYIANKSQGVPGYVKVDPVGQSAGYVELKNGMKYIPSSYFNKNLERHLRFQYPTAIFKNIHFEVDEEGNPYYIASVMDYTIGVFGGETVKGTVACDPITGECTYYEVSKVPAWIDNVFYGNLLVKQYNWYGQLSNGYFNSIFAKKGCKKCTETEYAAAASDEDEEDSEHDTAPDYGYIAKDGDIWIYTGVTSVNDDASNIGFIMVNERTGEAHFFTIAGADENSAMDAAEGEVQEKGYVASFPSLINVNGTATYICVLKDANSIVKLYAMVNVEQYNIVATGSDLQECFTKYKKKLGGDFTSDIQDEDDSSDDSSDESNTEAEDTREILDAELTITKIQYVDIEGNTYVYVTAEDDTIYRVKFTDYPQALLWKAGSTVQVGYSDGDQDVRDIREVK